MCYLLHTMNKYFAIFGFSMVFFGQAVGFEWREHKTYVGLGHYDLKEFVWFEPDEFPLSICPLIGHFSQDELDYIFSAVEIWNDHYTYFVKNRWPGRIVYGLPGSSFMMHRRLFTLSCKEKGDGFRKGFVIPIRKGVVSQYSDKTLGVLSRDWTWFAGTSMEIIMDMRSIMEVDRYNPDVKKPYFRDIVLHEMGHTIGLPHLKNDALMRPHMGECQKRKIEQRKPRTICVPRNGAFEAFIEMYDYKVLSEQESKAEFQRQRNKPPPRAPNGMYL